MLGTSHPPVGPAPWVSQLSQLDGTVSPVPMGPALNEDISSVSQSQDAPLGRRTYPGSFHRITSAAFRGV